MALSKKERSKLAGRIAKATGTAKYAIEVKMSDDDLLKAFNNVEILAIMKPSNDYNRYKQGLLTGEANKKTEIVKAENENLKVKLQDIMQQLLDLKNSEIYRLGVWLVSSLSLSGKERQEALKEKDLVHADDYKSSVEDLIDTIKTQRDLFREDTLATGKNIKEMERKIDDLREQLIFVQNYIINNEGKDKWLEISRYMTSKKPNQNAK